ncbi:MAG: aldo/keto reductase [Chloroflexota bacterium]|nr:aldo/keto reductase [Chloroflexota bacterium]
MDENTLRLHTGRQMPVIGLGTWQLTNDTAGTVERALELGYRMIDTSGDYGTQPGVGEGVRRAGLPREEVYVTTKVEEDDDAYEATRRNLDELGLDYADLMLIHRPPPRGVGEQLWEGLLRARQEGLARDIGVSNYSVDQIARLADLNGEMPAVNQIEWSPFGWSADVLDFCRQREIVIQAYSPLTRAERLDDDRLRPMATEYGRSPAQLLLRWAIQKGTAPIPKANRDGHLREDIDVFDFEIAHEGMRRLDQLNERWSSLGASLQYG